MVEVRRQHPAERVAIVQWTARMGAITAEALACRQRIGVASARSRLLAAERDGLLSRRRLLVGQPALYIHTRAGMRVSGLRELRLCRVSSANAVHLIACAAVAAGLEHAYPDHRLVGERELACAEREQGVPFASARLPGGYRGGPLVHRPDLALLPKPPAPGKPVVVEVELTVKAPRRLEDICRAWARNRHLGGALYLAPADVERALERAIERARADERVVVAPLDALVLHAPRYADTLARTIPSAS
jgi:hypothetical protein